MQAFKSQLTAGAAEAALTPKMNIVDNMASDKRRDIDNSCEIIMTKTCVVQSTE
jgi:hypothetical protein